MKITITFDSLEEFNKHVIRVPEAALAQKAPEAPQSDEEPKPKKSPKKAEKPQEEDAGQPDEAPEEEEAPEVSEDFRVEVRKALAKLNKKVGKNLASDLIKEFGVEKLTEVALSDLPALMDKAKEALNAE
jgi:hypothetical protein